MGSRGGTKITRVTAADAGWKLEDIKHERESANLERSKEVEAVYEGMQHAPAELHGFEVKIVH